MALRSLTIPLLLVFSLAGCRASLADTAPARPLEGTSWRLSRVDGRPSITATARETPSLTLDAASHRASGNGGCNLYGAEYTRIGGALRFVSLVSTERACIRADLGQQEGALLRALATTTGWRIEGDTLILSAAAGELARFVAEPRL